MSIWMKRWLGRSEGYFTIEASLLFPLLLIITLVLVYSSMFFYHYTSIYYSAQTLAERTSFGWHQLYVDGDETVVDRSLYKRQYESMLNMFNSSSAQSHTVTLPVNPDGNNEQSYRGIGEKLQLSAMESGHEMKGTINYVQRLLESRIQVELLPTMTLPRVTSYFLDGAVRARASAMIVDPVEYIRTVGLIESYLSQLLQKGISKEAAKEAWQQFRGGNDPPIIKNHHDAFTYLQQLVDGRELHLDTSHGKRMIDAFDRQSISHQAYYTFTTSGLRVQLDKDAELLADGRIVKGVVWHFFDKAPSDGLRKEIEDKGIVIIVHD